ncbi:MAG TPA: hypothetical protein VJ690_12055 [Burkholderiales bacterium]|nr:hypothetical protein [Burkholderiales bacterium]
MNNPGCSEAAALVAGLLVCLPDIRSVWSMDHEPAGAHVPREPARLLVFADAATLHLLQSVPRVAGVEVLVVTDDDAVQSWAWRRTSASEAFYDEARWAEDGITVVRVRRKAQLVWPTPAAAK